MLLPISQPVDSSGCFQAGKFPSPTLLSPCSARGSEHPFRVIKRQFGLVTVRFRGLQKNTAHVLTLFALSNLWMARRPLMAMMG